MPTNNRFGLDDYHRILPGETKSPARPSRTAGPEGVTAAWAASASGRHLLAQGEEFDSDLSAALEEDAGGGNEGEEE